MRRATLLAALLASLAGDAALAAPAPARPRIWFDARQPGARPLARVTIDGAPHVFLLDSGSDRHVWSVAEARRAGTLRDPAPPMYDYEARAHDVERGRVEVAVPELDVTFSGIDISDWTDALQPRDPDAPRFDGVLSPHQLVAGGGALVIDLLRGEIALTTRDDARRALEASDTLPVADAPFEDGHYLASVQVGDEKFRLAVDTGAPVTAVYAPRSLELPNGFSRRGLRPGRARVGPLMRDLTVEVIEPLADPQVDGMLGMDVLRDCVMAIDAEHLELRCRADARDAHGDSSRSVLAERAGHHDPICLGSELCLQPTAAGRYRFIGDRIAAEIDRDGNLTILPLRGERPLAMRSTHDETEWLRDATALFRYHVGHERALARSFDFLPRHLAAVWGDTRYSAAERREVLFRIWDECAEPSDHELAAAGRRARRAIERFVRRRLPRGSPDGFDDGELERLNARRSDGPRFEPYHPDRSQDRDQL